MNFRICLDCKKTSWFDINFVFLRIGDKQITKFQEECNKFNIEKGDYLIAFSPEIRCDCICKDSCHPGLDLDWMLNRFYFKNPEYMKFALLKKSFIKRNKIRVIDLVGVSASLFLKPKENKTYYLCDVEPTVLRDVLIDYMKFVEKNMFPSNDCKFSFEHIVFGGK